MSLLKSILNIDDFMHQGQNSLGLDQPQDQQGQKGLKNQFQSLLPMD